MILEAAILEIKAGFEQQFERDFALASKYISTVEGYQRHRLQKCLEQTNKYLLLVEWRTLKAHTVGFRTSTQYLEWKKLLHHYYDPFPTVEHFEKVFEQSR